MPKRIKIWLVRYHGNTVNTVVIVPRDLCSWLALFKPARKDGIVLPIN